MDAATRDYLRALNRRFYDHFASHFSDTRQHAWPGWQSIPRHLNTAQPKPTVLDVGCGNGRFATFLSRSWRQDLRYVGLDGSSELLTQARARADDVARLELLQADVVRDRLTEHLGDRRFDLVALFGVLHHVPGHGARRDLLRRLARRLTPGGILAVSIWRLDRTPNFSRKVVPWQDYLARGGGAPPLEGCPPGSKLDLEPGDTLLSWAGQRDVPRYCHFPSNAEIDGWIEAVGASLIDRFPADGPTGRDNLYLLFRHSGKGP
ncbi:MAG: class I SAM-dependent methyltransferase [Acidobacteriota bacterium]